MFEDIQKQLGAAFGKFRARGVLTESNIQEGLREVRGPVGSGRQLQRRSRLHEAGRRQGGRHQLIKSVRPEQQIVKIVYDEMLELIGEPDPTIRMEKSGPTILMLCGLQGSGKTTTCGKLAKLLANQGRKPLLVAADLQRPAAVDQLKIIGQQLQLPVYSQSGASDPVKVCQDAVIEANRQGRDTILLDTAGRLHIDDDLMNELRLVEKKVRPHHVYFVCDALTGQDAVASAGAFNQALELDGVIMTKLDGDARGGAALSVRQVTGVPIKFVGMGEKLDKLQVFDPQRLVGQMLGMGDIVGLVEAAQSVVNQDEARRQQEKMAKGKFDLDDFRKQMTAMKRMGSMRDLVKMIPGLSQAFDQIEGFDLNADDAVKRLGGIIDSMTPLERADPKLINISRRRRIASGAGVEEAEVSGLVKQFDAMASMVKQMSKMSMLDRLRAMTSLGKMSAFPTRRETGRPQARDRQTPQPQGTRKAPQIA